MTDSRNLALRELTPEEKVVFDLLAKHQEQDGNCYGRFVYDARQGQRELMHNGQASKYGIGYEEQNKIIKKLADDGIIKADWVIGINPNAVIDFDSGFLSNKFKFRCNSNEKEVQMQYAEFFYNLYTVNDTIEDYDGIYFIQLESTWVKKINDANTARCHCELAYDSTIGHFTVECEGEVLTIKKLRGGKRPSKILKYALERPRKIITRDELNKSNSSELHVRKQSLATEVFDPRSIINHELEPFVKLSNDIICVYPIVDLTPLQLEELKMVCF